MRYELTVGLRYTRARRRNRFIGINSAISMIGIAVGVWALIVVLSVMNGFQKEVRTRILGVASHVQITGIENRLADLARVLGALPGDKVAVVAPQGLVTPAGVIPRLKQFTVAGTFEAGFNEADAGLALV